MCLHQTPSSRNFSLHNRTHNTRNSVLWGRRPSGKMWHETFCWRVTFPHRRLSRTTANIAQETNCTRFAKHLSSAQRKDAKSVRRTWHITHLDLNLLCSQFIDNYNEQWRKEERKPVIVRLKEMIHIKWIHTYFHWKFWILGWNSKNI